MANLCLLIVMAAMAMAVALAHRVPSTHPAPELSPVRQAAPPSPSPSPELSPARQAAPPSPSPSPSPAPALTPQHSPSSPSPHYLSNPELAGLLSALILLAVAAGVLGGLFIRSIGQKMFPSLRLVRKEAAIPEQHDGDAGSPGAIEGHTGESGPSVLPVGGPGAGSPPGGSGASGGRSGEPGFPVGGPGFGSPPGRPTLLLEHMTYAQIQELMRENVNNPNPTKNSINAIKALQLTAYQKTLMPKIMLGLIYEGIDWFELALILLSLKDDADYYHYKIDEPLEHLHILRMQSADIANNMGRFYGTLYDDKLEQSVLRFFRLSADAVLGEPFLVSFLQGFFWEVESIDFAHHNGFLDHFFSAASDQDKVVCRDFITDLKGNYKVKGILRSLFLNACGEDHEDETE